MIYELKLCINDEVIPVEFDRSTPTLGATFSATGSTGEIVCGIVGSTTLGISNYTASTEYESCYECLSATTPTIMANEPYEVCVTCSGSTFTVEPPHPVWTGLYGETIIQENAVLLGGSNGLYS
jgi:hypothetical protein